MLNDLVEAQTTIANADHDLVGVMTMSAEASLALTGAEAACIELLEEDEVVCAAAAGAGVPHVGLRLKADASITGECFRTRQVLVCTDAEEDSRVAREACRLVGARSLIVVPLIHADDVKGVLIVWSSTARDFRGYEAQLLTLLANMIGAALVRAELIAKLTDQAATDELTGLPNRRAWYRQLDQALARARRTGGPLTVLALDLDGFKQVNDRDGHIAGDRLLKAVTSQWLTELRTTDLLGRIGGDEFAVILEGTDAASALDVVSRLDGAAAGHHPSSVGIAAWDGSEDAAALVARADADMYVYKRARTAA
jgi:diguanylate cyclase (GGDEF)-like protein